MSKQLWTMNWKQLIKVWHMNKVSIIHNTCNVRLIEFIFQIGIGGIKWQKLNYLVEWIFLGNQRLSVT